MTLYFILCYFAIGIFAGTMSGLLGIGGGIVVVPAFAAMFFHFGLVPETLFMKMAIGTSLAIMIVTLTASVFAHHKRRAINWPLVKKIFPFLMLGVMVGAVFVRFLPSNFLSRFFSLFLFVIGCQLLLKKSNKEAIEMIPKQISYAYIWLFSFIIGILSSLLGAGGGTMWVPFFLWKSLPMREAVGTSVACGIIAAIIATGSFIISGIFVEQTLPWSTSYIYWPAFFGVSAMSVMFAPLGAMLANKLPSETLRRIFAVFMILMAIDMSFF